MDEAQILGKANTFSLCGVGGETGYTAQEDQKSVNSYITLTRWAFVGKVMSLLFNMLSGWS